MLETIAIVLGLVLGAASLPWTRRPIEALWRRLRVKKLAVQHRLRRLPYGFQKIVAIRDGTWRGHASDFMVLEWDHRLSVEADGTAETDIDCALVNTSQTPQQFVLFPLYLDLEEKNRSRISSCWVRVGRMRFERTVEWNEDLVGGFLTIPFPVALTPGNDIRIRWGYSVSRLFTPGRHYFEWYIGRPHARLRFVFRFVGWGATGLASTATAGQPPPAPRYRQGAYVWRISAPPVGGKYRLDFTLAAPRGRADNDRVGRAPG